MLRVNGLFGWVSYNDRRSAVLFLCFVLAFHVLAAAVLFIPLAILDPPHTPILGWGGYSARYLPIVTLAGAGLFLVLFWWHVNLIQRRSGFRYTYKREEPRLCSIAEPLVIAAGLPEPRLAIIESPALNAFACGLSRESAVIVFTRGLLNELDDDELAAVIAHELVHIKNDDLRLMAAATVCQRCMSVVYNQGSWGGRKYQEAFALAMSLILLPVLFLVFVAMNVLRHSAINFGFITRALISSAREFIADSEAVRLTKNPAALVSALRKINGRSDVDCLPGEIEGMMIDGPSAGTFATHPTIADRIAAIVRLTGSMTMVAPVRRDTRQNIAYRRPRLLLKPTTVSAEPRVSSIEAPTDRNILGFTPQMSIATVAAIAAFLYMNRVDLDEPRRLLARFNVSEFGLVMQAIGQTSNCSGMFGSRERCNEAEIGKGLAEHKGPKSIIGQQVVMMSQLPEGFYRLPGGGFTNVPPDHVKLEIARKNTCFHSDRYSVGDRGLHRVDEPDRGHSSDISLKKYLGYISRSVTNIDAVGPKQRDEMLKSYVNQRKLMIWVIHRFYGEPGLDIALQTYATSVHATVLDEIKTRMTDPAFTKSMSAIERAEYDLLLDAPEQFITCVARKTRPIG